jgi:hypothetical protein
MGVDITAAPKRIPHACTFQHKAMLLEEADGGSVVRVGLKLDVEYTKPAAAKVDS